MPAPPPQSALYAGNVEAASAGNGGGPSSLGIAALRAIIHGAAGSEFAMHERQRTEKLRSAIVSTMQDLVDALRRDMKAPHHAGGAAADDIVVNGGVGSRHPASGSTDSSLVHNAAEAVFQPIAKEVKASYDAQLRLRKAEVEMDFMAGQIARRDELAMAQRREMLKHLSLCQERLYTAKETNIKLHALNMKMRQQLAEATARLASGHSPNHGKATTVQLGSLLGSGTASDGLGSSVFDAVDTTSAVGLAPNDAAASLTVNGVGSDAQALSAQMQADWDRIRMAEESAAREEAIRREADERIRELAAKHRHDELRLNQRAQKRLEEALKMEGLRLEARVRQLEHQLRKKESEVEQSLAKERAKWLGSNARSSAAAEAQLRLMKRRFVSVRESLLMQLHDERAQFGTAYDKLQRDSRLAIDTLTDQVATLTKAKDRIAASLVAAQAAGKAGENPDAVKARAVLIAQLRSSEEELAKSRAETVAARSAAAAAASATGASASSNGGATGAKGDKGDDARGRTGASHAPPVESYLGNPHHQAAVTTHAAATLRTELHSLEVKCRDALDAKIRADVVHREALDTAVAECDALRKEVDARDAIIAALRIQCEDLTLEHNASLGERRDRTVPTSRASTGHHAGKTPSGVASAPSPARDVESSSRLLSRSSRLEDASRPDSSVGGGALGGSQSPAAAGVGGRAASARRESIDGRNSSLPTSPTAVAGASGGHPHHHQGGGVHHRERQLEDLCEDLVTTVQHLTARTPAPPAGGGSSWLDGSLEQLEAELRREISATLLSHSSSNASPAALHPSHSPRATPSSLATAAAAAQSSERLTSAVMGVLRRHSSTLAPQQLSALPQLHDLSDVVGVSSGTHRPHSAAAAAAASGPLSPGAERRSSSHVATSASPALPVAAKGANVVERSTVMMQHAAARRAQLSEERRAKTEGTAQLSLAPATQPSHHLVFVDETGHDERVDSTVPSRGVVWLDLGDVIARAQRLLVQRPSEQFIGLTDAERATSAGRALQQQAMHDIRFTVKSCGTQTSPVTVCELPAGFTFAPECFAGMSSSRTDTDYLVLLCNPLHQSLSCNSLRLVSPPFVYEAGAHFVPTEAEHVQRLADFADNAMSSIVSMLASRGAAVVPETVDSRFVYRSSPSKHRPPSVGTARPTSARVVDSAAAATQGHAGAATGEVSERALERETLSMVYRHRDGRRPMLPRPPAATPEGEGDDDDGAEGPAAHIQRVAMLDAAVKTIMTARRRGSPPSHSAPAGHPREPEPPHQQQQPAVYRPMLMTQVPAPLAHRNNPYATLKASSRPTSAAQQRRTAQSRGTPTAATTPRPLAGS